MMTHGDARMRRGGASMAQKCVGASHPPDAVPGPPQARSARGAGRWHGFPRSHGPAQHKVKMPWLTLRCRANPSPSSTRPIPSGPCPTSEVKMPKEPKSRRNPGESAIMTGQAEGHARAPQSPSWIGVSQRCSKHRRNPSAAEIHDNRSRSWCEGTRLACREGIGLLAMTQASKGDFADRAGHRRARWVRPATVAWTTQALGRIRHGSQDR
jgi:hypothetical protein